MTEEQIQQLKELISEAENPDDFRDALHTANVDYFNRIYNEGRNKGQSSVESDLKSLRQERDELQEQVETLGGTTDEIKQKYATLRKEKKQLENSLEEAKQQSTEKIRDFHKQTFTSRLESKLKERYDPDFAEVQAMKWSQRVEGTEDGVVLQDEVGNPLDTIEDPFSYVTGKVKESPKADKFRSSKPESTGLGDTSGSSGGQVYSWDQVKDDPKLFQQYENDEIEVAN